MLRNLIVIPLKRGMEGALTLLVLYMLVCTTFQTVQWVQGARKLWRTATNYQEQIEQVQSWNPFN